MHNQVSKCLCQSVELNQKAREIDYAISVTVLRVEEEYCFPTATACEKGEGPLQGTIRTEPCESLSILSSRRCVPFGSQTMPSLVSKSCRATKAVCGSWTSRVRIISVFSWFVLLRLWCQKSDHWDGGVPLLVSPMSKKFQFQLIRWNLVMIWKLIWRRLQNLPNIFLVCGLMWTRDWDQEGKSPTTSPGQKRFEPLAIYFFTLIFNSFSSERMQSRPDLVWI